MEKNKNQLKKRVFGLKIAKNGVYWCYRYYSKLFGKMRREAEFRQRCCRNCKKKYNMSGERENWISVMRLSKFLSYLYYQACPCPKCVLGGALEMETNCGNGIPKMGEKKNATSITFFTTNYKWLVVISSNLNLILRLLFCPNNNNQ